MDIIVFYPIIWVQELLPDSFSNYYTEVLVITFILILVILYGVGWLVDLVIRRLTAWPLATRLFRVYLPAAYLFLFAFIFIFNV